MVPRMLRSFAVGLVVGALTAVALHGCATGPVTGGWSVGIDPGGPHEGGPEVDPVEPNIGGAPLDW